LATALGPCVLEGNHVRLEPLGPSHASGLLAAAQESDWTWLTVDPRGKNAMDEWIKIALKAEERGLEHPFTVFSREDHQVLGSTRYVDIRPLQGMGDCRQPGMQVPADGTRLRGLERSARAA